MELDQETMKKLREKGKQSLFFFARAILGFAELDPKIHRPACKALEDYEHNTRIVVVFPRTWFKSTIASIAYPIWRSINDPNSRGLIAQSTYDNACKKLRAIAGVFEKNNLFRALYADILPTKQCRWSGECLEVKRTNAHPEGTFEAAGVGTTTTSRHYDYIIQDDTIAPKKDDMTGIIQQPTQMDIEKAIGWHSLCHPMLLHPKNSQIVIVGTRWAERDLIGYIKEKFPDYHIIEKTACEKDGEPCGLDDGGTPTWDRFDADVLREIEANEGPYMFACLYLNKPTAAINQVFRREWIRYYDNKPKQCFACTSVDLAAAEKEESSNPDYNVITTTAVDPRSGRIYVLEYTRDRMSPSDVINVIFDHYHRYHPTKTIVEAIGYQRVLMHYIQQRQRKQNCLFYIDQLKGYGKVSKQERIRSLQAYFSDGLIMIREGMDELEHELLAFPKGQHDDILDTLSMQKRFWIEIMDLSKLEVDAKPQDPFSGSAVIDELKGRFSGIGAYPYDMGNVEDQYFDDIGIRSSGMKQRIRGHLEDSRILMA